MSRRVLVPLAALLACGLVLPSSALGWGFAAHRLVNRRAAAALPDPLRGLFSGNAAYLQAHAIDPDLWVMAGNRSEGPNHFLDLDAFGRWPFDTVSRDEAVHLQRAGADAAAKGRLPWRIAEAHRDLAAAFRARDERRILQAAAVLGHYAADANVPLHAAVNYDGQLTGQKGAHGRWESALFSRFERQIEPLVSPAAARPAGDPVATAFAALTASYAASLPALASDRESAGARDYLETPEDDRYDDPFYSLLFEREALRIAARLTAAAETVSSLWLSAWEEAGRPELDAAWRPACVRGESRVVVAVLDGAPAALLEDAIGRRLMPSLGSLRAAGTSGRLAVPAGVSLWSGAAADAEPAWIAAAREGLNATVLAVPQSVPFAPYLADRRFGANFDRSLVLLAPDPARAGAALSNRDLVAAAVQTGGGLPAGAEHERYASGGLGPPLWAGGDGSAERRYVDTVRAAAEQHARIAALVLDRTRFSLAALQLPFPREALQLWAERLEPARATHDPALAARLRPFADEVMQLADGWLGEVNRHLPKDAALVVVGLPDPGQSGFVGLAGAGVARGAIGDAGVDQVAPTVSALLGIGPPKQARGRVIDAALARHDGPAVAASGR